jgi:hypothetical protein
LGCAWQAELEKKIWRERFWARKKSLETQRTFGMHILLLERMQFVPKSKRAGNDQSNEKANQKEPAIGWEHDQQNSYYTRCHD